MQELIEKIEEIEKNLEKIKKFLNFEKIREEIEIQEKEITKENFWNDRKKAETISQNLSDNKKTLETWENIEKEASDLKELAEITEESESSELQEQIANLEERISKNEVLVFLSGEYDKSDAIVSIFAGTGGTDAQDWAEMLLRMYLRFAEEKNFKTSILDKSQGDEAGIKSVSFEVKGKFAYGLLKCEKGVHRLVRLSPFNAKNLRQTSFAQVSAVPIIESGLDFEINQSDLKIDTFRASGAGGQHVNTTDSAIRITHIPTGIVVSCQNERSQLQNKETCLKILRGKLFDLKTKEEEEKVNKEKGEYKETSWGNQIRSYVLHPYKMVKDLRTGVEKGNAEKVLDGDIQDFIDAELKRDKTKY